MRVENTGAEVADEFHIVHALIAEVTRIVVKSETWVMVNRFQRSRRTGNIKGDFRRMHFQREIHTLCFKHIENRRPTIGEVLETGLDLTGHDWRERVQQVPD